MEELNSTLSRFISALKYEDIDEETLSNTKLFIIDYFAACIAGISVNRDFNDIVLSVIDEAKENGEVSAFMSGKKYSAPTAAFLNAMYAHGADMDDGNKKAMGHVGCHVISTAFAVAEEIGASGKDIITAVVAGYEVYNRLAAAVQPGLVRRGFHSTGTAGVLACAAVASKLYGLSENQIYNAVSFAAVQTAGLMIITESGQTCKPINPANAARTGIFAAKCAKKGVVAPKRIFESEKGWMSAMSQNVDLSFVLDTLGKKFTVNESYIKPYPSCRHTHCSMEGIEKIRKDFTKDGYSVEDIEKIRIYIYKNAIYVAGKVIHPTCPEDTKFSIHYSAAAMMLKGEFGLADLEDYKNPAINELIDKIELIEEDSMENTKEGIRGSRVEVTMKDKNTYTATVLSPKGEYPNPMSLFDLRKKLEACIRFSGENVSCDKIVDNVTAMEKIIKFDGINNLLFGEILPKKE